MATDDFDIDSLAAYLHLTPDQVRKMAERGRLPGRRVGGSWRFSRAEIHHWFEDKIGASDESELIAVEKVLDRHSRPTAEPDLDLAQLLSIERIALPLNARTKNSVIDEICKFAASTGALWLPEDMADAIRSREELHPTALGNGVALLHPRRPQPSLYGDSFLALGVTSSGIPFGGPRGALTDIFFLIASTDESTHLRTLARLSRMIQVGTFLDEIRSCEGAAQAWQIIHDTDQSLD